MEEQGPKQKRPHAVLRALLSFWLIAWLILIVFFLRSQFDPQPLLNWGAASIWLVFSVVGWLIVYRLLRKLRRLPPE